MATLVGVTEQHQPPFQGGPPPARHLLPPDSPPAPGYGVGWQPSRRGRGKPGQVPLLVGGVLTLVLLCCGGFTVIGALAEPTPQPAPEPVAGAGTLPTYGKPTTTPSPLTPSEPSPSATASATASESSPSASIPPSATPVVQTRTVTETERIGHAVRTVKDASLAKGKRVVRTRGVDGVRTLTYQITVTDGVQTGRKLVRSVVTRQPVTEVVAVGTKPVSRCDPNYSGCVPIASDVDCAGGGGDGPAYVTGPIRVIGKDIYRLDRDGDGWACED